MTRLIPLLLLLGCGPESPDDPQKKPTTGTDPTTTDTTTTTTTTTTSTTSTPPSDLIGNTYAVDLLAGTWVQPATLGPLISGLLGIELLLGIDDVQPPDLFMSAALADQTGSQDPCTASIELPTPADFSNDPDYVLQAAGMTVDTAGLTVDMYNVVISATFSANTREMQNMRFEGTIDVAPFDLLLLANTCDLLQTFGTSCVACPGGVTATCIDIVVSNLTASQVQGLTLQTITQADVDADPNCP